ncbi:MAG: glycosyltransferase family 2 protein, partial [Actinomycetota bacterium]|nr:glycosyltransferase family 2 protein [Actinomycetota bacterium]
MTTPQPTAPPVVAVLVAHDPGDWFDEVLDSLVAQDYPRLGTLVIDSGVTDVADRVAARLPGAAVSKVPADRGYGAAANEVAGLVQGAAFYLFLHDDVALAPDAVRLLVEEALKSNAGIVGPKLVDWHDTERIRALGGSIDAIGVLSPYAEPGELDQEQHDRVRDAFVVTGGAMLIRSDLFHTIGGFDPTITFLIDDVDLCWRAHLAGGRVVVAPQAVVRHLEALSVRRDAAERRRLLFRHRLHTISKCYGWVHLLWVLPFALLTSLLEILYSLVLGRFSQARDIASAWLWNLAHMPRILAGRRQVKGYRRVRDSKLRRLQVGGSARLSAFLRGQIGGDAGLQILASRGRRFTGTFRSGPRRTALVTWGLLLALLAFGTRHLMTRGVPSFGQFAELPDAGAMLHAYWGGWRETGLGAAGTGPAGIGLLGLAGTVLLGATGLLRLVLIIGPLPLGLLGMWRLVGPLDSRRGRLAAVVLYAANPLSYNALSGGRWDTLLLYATMPFLVLRLNRLIGISPYGSRGGEPGPGVPSRSLRHQLVTLALMLAVVAAFEPLVLVLVPALAVALVVVSILTGSALLPARSVLLAIGAAVLASALHLPWALQFGDFDDLLTQLVGRPNASAPEELHRLMRFETGPYGSTWFAWGPLIAAAVPLVISRGPRLAWAARAWGLALAGLAGAWVSANGWLTDALGLQLSIGELLLVPAAVGLAWATAAGFASYEVDVPRFAFGWRQLTIAIGAVAMASAVAPAVLATADGRWQTPTNDLEVSLSLIDDRGAGESYRVLWIGAEEVLPLDGWQIGDLDLLIAMTVRGYPDVRHQWAGPLTDDHQLLIEAVELGLGGETARLGRLLAPFGVQYVVAVEQGTPSFSDGIELPLPTEPRRALTSQLDLRPVAADPSVLVFENEAYLSSRAQFDGLAPFTTIDDPTELVVTDVSAGIAVLKDRRSSTEQHGPIGIGPVLVAEPMSEGWRLEVGDTIIEPESSFG